MTVKYRPLGDNVLVLPDSAEETTETGIIIPDTAQLKPKRGCVVALGREVEEKDLIVGDVIWHGIYAGAEVKGTPYIVLPLADVLLVEDDDGLEEKVIKEAAPPEPAQADLIDRPELLKVAVGDCVRLKARDIQKELYGEDEKGNIVGCQKEMEKWFGELVVVKQLEYKNDDTIFRIVDDEGKWLWSSRQIDSVIEKEEV